MEVLALISSQHRATNMLMVREAILFDMSAEHSDSFSDWTRLRASLEIPQGETLVPKPRAELFCFQAVF